MRVRTVRQPWAWAIIHGGKNVENRVRNLAGDYRGTVAIHAGKAWDASRYDNPKEWEIRGAITSLENGWPAADSEVWAAETAEPDDARFVHGAIIGVVELTGVHRSQLRDVRRHRGGTCLLRSAHSDRAALLAVGREDEFAPWAV